MNRQQLYTLSGVLLASTAMTGVASASSIKTGNGAAPITFSTSALKVANTIFSTTASTADSVSIGGGEAVQINFANKFNQTSNFSVEIDVAGAQFNTASIGEAKIILADAAVTNAGTAQVLSVVAASAVCSITPLVNAIDIDNCVLNNSTTVTGTTGLGADGSFAATGLLLSGVTFNTANALATVGNSIALSGKVKNGNDPSQIFETITSASIITSAAGLSATVSACTDVVADPLATPAAFDYLKTNNIGTTNLTMCLATVALTGSGALTAALNTASNLDSLATSVAVTVTNTVLASAAVSQLSVTGTSGTAALSTLTPAAFASGSATFHLGALSTTATTFSINVLFTGTTPIPAAAAGTVGLTFGSGGGASVVAATAVNGTTAKITRGGFNGELNTFLASSNTSFTSFARIHNMGVTPGAATVTVLNDATGAQLGSAFTTATIAAGQTLQLSNSDIETAAGITAAAGVNYTVQITGPFIGYAQHIIFNPATGQLADLSGFRNAGNTSQP